MLSGQGSERFTCDQPNSECGCFGLCVDRDQPQTDLRGLRGSDNSEADEYGSGQR